MKDKIATDPNVIYDQLQENQMEDYDTFVQNRLAQMRNKEEEHQKSASSAIRFYGAPILPPVLTDTRIAEMQQHKEVAQRNDVSRRMNGNERLAYVQTILHSVQMRHSPTLEDLLQELKVTPKSLDSSNSSESSHQSVNTVAEMNSPHFGPLPSTTNSAFSSSRVIPQPNHKGGCLVERCRNQQASESESSSFNSASDCSISLGCLAHAIMDTSGLSESLGRSNDGHGPRGTNNTTDVFLHKTSKRIATMQDIISYPPIDGEELERSGQESSFCHDFLTRNEDSVRSDHFPGEENETSQMESTMCQHNPPSSAVLNMKESQKMKQVVVPVPSLDVCSTSDIADLPQTPSIDCSCTDELTQSNPANEETMDTQVPQSQSQPPNRPSLQDLLRKSQEYRWHQRMLRNQAKNARMQEKAQEQPRVEEKSLSDKENNEFHSKSTEGRKTKEKRFVKTINTICKKYSEKNPVFLDELISKKANRDPERAPEQITLPHSQPLSQSQTQKVNHMTSVQASTDPVTSLKGHGTHHSIPVPHFCPSPVYNKGSSSLPDEEDTFRGSVSISSSCKESYEADERNPGLQSDGPSVIVQSSQHINQLESGLSVLKELISDLGSSLMEIEGKCEDRPDEDDVGKRDQRNNEGPDRQSLESWRSVLEYTDERNNSNKDNDPSILQNEEKEVVNLEEFSLVNTFTLQGGINEDAVNMSSRQLEGSGTQQPPAKCALSLAKWMPMPDVFRNVPSEPTAPHDVSVLASSKSHPTERKPELAEDSHSFTRKLSVDRQSFDVDTPSEVWLLECSGSEQDSRDHLIQAKGLTPVSVVGIEGTSSKVKRRLLMHATDNLDMTAAPSSEDLSEVKHSYGFSSVSSPGSDHFAEELKQVHVAQVRALQEEHKRQQEELCQALAMRYCLLQGSSFLWSLSGSRLGDTVTFSKISQPPSSHLEHCRPLLLAAVKGYLTRRLLRTERVAQLVRTIGDTQQFLQAFQLPPHRGDICSKQDRLLQQRVSLQLRAARYEMYDIFFCLSVAERMHLISLDRELARERVLRRQMGHTSCPKGRSSLSAATQKSLLRKRGILIQKMSERLRGVVTTDDKTGFMSEQPLDTKRGRLRTKPAKSSQSFFSCRPR